MNLRPAWGNDDFDFHKSRWSRDKFNRWRNNNDDDPLYPKKYLTVKTEVSSGMVISVFMGVIILVLFLMMINNRR